MIGLVILGAIAIVIWMCVVFREDIIKNAKLPKKEEKESELFKRLSELKIGDVIKVEHHRVTGRIGTPTVVNNEPHNKKLLIEFTWSNYKEVGCSEKEKFILDYSSIELQNFTLLNPKKKLEDDFDEMSDEEAIEFLQKDLQKAISEEDYERATKLKYNIENLNKQKNG